MLEFDDNGRTHWLRQRHDTSESASQIVIYAASLDGKISRRFSRMSVGSFDSRS